MLLTLKIIPLDVTDLFFVEWTQFTHIPMERLRGKFVVYFSEKNEENG